MTRALATVLVLLAVLAPAPAAAQARHLRGGEPVVLRGDSAYLLFRTDSRVMQDWFEFVFVRELGPPTGGPAAPPRLAASHTEAGQNLVKTDADRFFAKTADSRTFLLEVPPGSYFLAAVGYEAFAAIGTCLCMGTVRFEARAGVVTDLGYLLASLEDRPTAIPELANVTNPPTEYGVGPDMVAAAIRPPAPGMPVPAELAAATLVPADYRAVGKYPNYFRTMISRLNPVPGVLDYERDRVIDVKAR